MRRIYLIVALSAVAVGQIQADTITTNDVTLTLGPNFFFDTAATGGGDTTLATSVSFTRDFGAFTTGPSTISITGLGWAVGGNLGVANPTTFFADVTFTYLGADNALGGGDDVLIGTTSDNYLYQGAGEYAWLFSTPLSANITPNPTVNDFLITMNGYTDNTLATGSNLRFKTTSGTGLGAAKLSVAGTPVVVPEPTTVALAGLGLAGLLAFRRRQ